MSKKKIKLPELGAVYSYNRVKTINLPGIHASDFSSNKTMFEIFENEKNADVVTISLGDRLTLTGSSICWKLREDGTQLRVWIYIRLSDLKMFTCGIVGNELPSFFQKID